MVNYEIFRSQPIMTINDLAQIGPHNKREKKAYKSNKDIKLELTELVPLTSHIHCVVIPLVKKTK